MTSLQKLNKSIASKEIDMAELRLRMKLLANVRHTGDGTVNGFSSGERRSPSFWNSKQLAQLVLAAAYGALLEKFTRTIREPDGARNKVKAISVVFLIPFLRMQIFKRLLRASNR